MAKKVNPNIPLHLLAPPGEFRKEADLRDDVVLEPQEQKQGMSNPQPMDEGENEQGKEKKNEQQPVRNVGPGVNFAFQKKPAKLVDANLPDPGPSSQEPASLPAAAAPPAVQNAPAAAAPPITNSTMVKQLLNFSRAMKEQLGLANKPIRWDGKSNFPFNSWNEFDKKWNEVVPAEDNTHQSFFEDAAYTIIVQTLNWIDMTRGNKRKIPLQEHIQKHMVNFITCAQILRWKTGRANRQRVYERIEAMQAEDQTLVGVRAYFLKVE